MSIESNAAFNPSPWPLPAGGSRVLIPAERVAEISNDIRTAPLHPHGFGFYPQAQGHQMTRLDHGDHLVIYCVEGEGTCALSGVIHPVRAGDMMVLPAGTAHHYQADPKQPWSIFWMHLGGNAVTHWLKTFSDLNPVTPLGLHEGLIRDFRALLDSVADGFRIDNLVLASSLCQKILAMAALLADQHHDSQVSWLSRVHAFMDEHLDARLTLEDFNSLYQGGSRYQFIRHYKALTGQTPLSAFTHRKMSRACYLLDTGHEPVAAIAQLLGFDDPYYFSRAFTRVVGVSPTRYRDRGGV